MLRSIGAILSLGTVFLDTLSWHTSWHGKHWQGSSNVENGLFTWLQHSASQSLSEQPEQTLNARSKLARVLSKTRPFVDSWWCKKCYSAPAHSSTTWCRQQQKSSSIRLQLFLLQSDECKNCNCLLLIPRSVQHAKTMPDLNMPSNNFRLVGWETMVEGGSIRICDLTNQFSSVQYALKQWDKSVSSGTWNNGPLAGRLFLGLLPIHSQSKRRLNTAAKNLYTKWRETRIVIIQSENRNRQPATKL